MHKLKQQGGYKTSHDTNHSLLARSYEVQKINSQNNFR